MYNFSEATPAYGHKFNNLDAMNHFLERQNSTGTTSPIKSYSETNKIVHNFSGPIGTFCYLPV